jgi:diaminohydroxyphosphoribosylaminopyrimidine deaminase/5-amino-6-(5-phosphoribosylamino)uracil reductase
MADHNQYMTQALRLAEKGMYTCHPNPRVGCVIVKDGEVVGEGWHEKAGGPHAEIVALKQAKKNARDATLYVTLEPCCHKGKTGPCTEAIIKAGVRCVVIAMHDPNPEVSGKGVDQLKHAGIEVIEGVLDEQAAALNPGFIMRMSHGRPFVRCKLAMSMDGRTAMASGESQWITGPEAREDVHRLRARSSAIISGIATILKDDPSLTVRLDELKDNKNFTQPRRVILDPRLSTPPFARVLKQDGETMIVTGSQEPEIVDALVEEGAEILYRPTDQDTIDLTAVMGYLAEIEANEVLMETGATLSGAMLRAGLIDELIVYMAPHLMGNRARGLFDLPQIESMEQRIPVKIHDIRAFGDDWRITATIDQAAVEALR